VGNGKIASIGVAVRRRVTSHGLALNVHPDLSAFRRIVPCGLAWAEATSMERELGRPTSMEEVKRVWVSEFATIFGYGERKEACFRDIQSGFASASPAAPTTSA
jgi:lipoate-protein ligase B